MAWVGNMASRPNWSVGVEYDHLWMGRDSAGLRRSSHARRGHPHRQRGQPGCRHGHGSVELPLRRIRRTGHGQILIASIYATKAPAPPGLFCGYKFLALASFGICIASVALVLTLACRLPSSTYEPTFGYTTSQRAMRQEHTSLRKETEHLQRKQLLMEPRLRHRRNTIIPSCYHSVTHLDAACA